METEKKNAIVHKTTISLIGGESVNDFTRKLNKAGQEYLFQNLRIIKKDSWGYLKEAYSNSAVFSISKRDEPSKLYGVTFKRSENGGFEFSSPVEVEQFTQYRPIKNSVVMKRFKETLWG